MEKRSRLGRGLSSLLNSGGEDPVVNLPVVNLSTFENEMAMQSPSDGLSKLDQHVPGKLSTGEVFHVELSLIVPNPNQPRRAFAEAPLRALADSIKAAGVIQPIIVREVDDHFEVIAGERRWRAAKLAQLTQIPVIIRRIDFLQRSQLALIENIHRQDLNPMERAAGYQAILQETGLTHQELATKLGEERSGIANHLRLIDLPDSVRHLIADESISFGHAKLLAGVDQPEEQDRLAKLVVVKQLSVRALELEIKKPASRSTLPSESPIPHIVDLERRISRDLQMRAEVKQGVKGKKGKLVIHYASLDQFDELLNRLGIKVED